MKIRKFLFIFVYFIPAVFLSFMVWRDYSGRYLAEESLPKVKQAFFLDAGRKAVLITNGNYDLDANLYDTSTGQKTTTVQMKSGPSQELLATYQQGKLIAATLEPGWGLSVYAIDPSGQSEELVMGTIDMQSNLTGNAYVWRGRLMFSRATEVQAVNVGVVEAAQLKNANLNGWSKLPTRPERIAPVFNLKPNELPVPFYEADLIDGRTVYVSGLIKPDGKPDIMIGEKDAAFFVSQPIAIKQFSKTFGRDATRLLKQESDFPGRVRFYNSVTGDYGPYVPTPKPLYQTLVFPLNDEETLIAGSTAEDELNGTTAGYLYNEKSKKLTDVTPFLTHLTYDDLKSDQITFYKEANAGELYFSSPEAGAGWADTAGTGNMGIMTMPDMEALLRGPAGDGPSVQGFIDYVKEGGALVINWAAWLVIPLVSLVGLPLILMLLQRRHKRQIEDGELIQGTIADYYETGTYVNEQPQVAFKIRFEDEGIMKEVEVRKVVSYLTEMRRGMPVMISYNRKKHKAVLVTERDLPDQQPEMIRGAVLRSVDRHGSVNRGTAVLLHFEAEGRTYSVPAVQPAGFEYRTGERANLISVGGLIRLFRYKTLEDYDESRNVTLEGQVAKVERYPVTISGRQLQLLEVMVTIGDKRVKKINSQFVPQNLHVTTETVLPVVMQQDELDKEQRLLAGKQGAARVLRVEYTGTAGERPLARILVERGGSEYRIEQSIEPVYGVMPGDELWIAYDESTREALILNYASA